VNELNALENWFCSTSFWQRITEQKLLPWLLADVPLGDHVLEIGAGAGAATPELLRRAPRVISLEYDHALARKLAQSSAQPANVVQGDAVSLPFADRTFSCAVVILALHHLKSPALQDRAFAEVGRVLRPGGIFLAGEIPDGWLHRVMHIRSTFTPVHPASLAARLASAGFGSGLTVDSQSGLIRFYASRNS
jgi:SAM-dependent methyltransferase